MSRKRVEAICAEDHTQSKLKRPSSAEAAPETLTGGKLKAKQKSKASKLHDKSDAHLRHLESLHDKTHVRQNLKLPAHQRITLGDEGSSSKSKKSKEQSTGDDIDPGDSDDSDLPDPLQLLDAFSSSERQKDFGSDGSESNYSNSEIDALIRAAPSGDLSGSRKESKAPQVLDSQPSRSPAPDVSWLTTPSPPSKRKPESCGPLPKRVKREHELLSPALCAASSHPSQRQVCICFPARLSLRLNCSQQPLFSATLSDDEEVQFVDEAGWDVTEPAFIDHAEDFVLDSTLFDITHNPADEHLFPGSSFTVSQDHSTALGSKLPTGDCLTPRHSDTAGHGSSTAAKPNIAWEDESEDDGDNKDDLAELEAWLQSDAVEIIG